MLEVALHKLGGDAQARHFAGLRQVGRDMFDQGAPVANAGFVSELDGAQRFVRIELLPEGFHESILTSEPENRRGVEKNERNKRVCLLNVRTKLAMCKKKSLSF